MITEIFGKVEDILEYSGDLIQVTMPEKFPDFTYGEIDLNEDTVRIFNEDDDERVINEDSFKLEYKLVPIEPILV